MSLAQLFYLKETFRERVRRWRRACFQRRAQPSVLSPQHFTLESLEPRLLLSVTVPQGDLASLDVDLNGQADALTDGVVIIRHLFGFSGTALTEGAVDPAGQRTDPTEIATYLDSIRPSLNVDLNQQADALTDGIVIMRSLFGFTGTSLIDGAIDPGGQRTDPAAIAPFLDNMNPQREQVAPLVTAGLQQDSGVSATDGITFNATITGTIADLNQIVSFTAGFDSAPLANFTDLEPHLLPSGFFTLSSATLAQIAGGTLADGVHTLHLRVRDANGNLTILDRTFPLDTVAPAVPTFDLAVTSDTGPVGDHETSAGIVTLRGQTDPTTAIQLVGSGLSTLSTGTGTFQLPALSLAVGANPLILRATDLAGNQSEFTQIFTRLAATQQADVVLIWNQTMLEAIRLDASAPPIASRGMAMVSLAMYDALNAIDGTPGYYVSLPAVQGTDPNAAASAAAHRVLSYLYPGQQAFFDAQLAASLASIPDGPGKTNGLTLGQSIANAIIAIRATDGWNDFVDSVPGNQPGDWQPTAPMYDVALLPQWADLTPFALTSPEQFRPAGPPALDSAAYAAAFNDVKTLGLATGSTRTADQTEIARFWADGSGTYTPPGHWNQIAEQIAVQQGNSLSANARLFAQLNVALADAAITAWDAKYQYEFWRPIQAIQQADLDGNALTTKDASWTPLLISPPFPEYVSGHATFSGAAAEILTSLFGNSLAFSTTSVGLPTVIRTFTSFEQAAQEAGRSRIYGGIHFEFSNQDGLVSGKALADFVLSRFTVTTDTQGPKILLTQQPGTTTKTNLTLTGQVLDNLSGVAAVQVKTDNGTFVPITFNATGNVSFTTTLALDGTADGSHSLTFQATDHSGNSSTVLFKFTLDTQAPTIALTGPSAGAVLTMASRLTGTVSGTGSAITKLTYAFDGGTAMPMSIDPISGVIDEPLNLSKLTVGAHTLTVTAMDAAGNSTTTNVAINLAALIPLTITGLTPVSGASDVGSTFRPQVFFSRPINPTTLNANNFYATDSTGTKLAATIVPSQDGTFAWLFFTNPMPGGETITLHVDGTTISGAADGQALDADGNGTPGGIFTSTFSTVSLIPIPGTTITGRVVDPGPDLKPMTFDDIQAGADGVLHTPDDVFLHPIANAKVFIVGLESDAVFTDAQGNFTLTNVPAGNVKVAVDGRTATNAPAGVFFPEMVMDVTIEPGLPNTMMGSMGTAAEQRANETREEIYLPRLQQSILQTVSSTGNTTVIVDAIAAPNLTQEQRAQLQLIVQPGSLIDENGNPVTNGQVGISTVPPELVRDMLPPGILQHTFDITIQAPGVSAFNTPLQITFPNVFNAAPGAQLSFLSFDHTTGRLVIEGTATVSTDGLSVTTDPGQGITKPGWHGLAESGVLGKLLVTLFDLADNPCVEFGLNAGRVLALGLAAGAGLVGASAATPALLAAAGAFGAASLIDDVFEMAKNLLTADSAGVVVDATKAFSADLGGIFMEGSESQRRLSIIYANPSDAARKELAKASSLKFGLLGAAFKSINIGLTVAGALEAGVDCFNLGSATSPHMFAAAAAEVTLISQGLPETQRFFDDLIYAFAPIETALDLIMGDGLRGALPQNPNGYILEFKDSRWHVRELNGEVALDPSTGLPIIVELESVINPQFLTDGAFRGQIEALFRQAVQRANGLDGAVRSLSQSAVNMMAELQVRRDGILTQGGSVPATRDAWLAISSLSTGARVYTGPYSPSSGQSVFLPSEDTFFVEVYDPIRGFYGSQSFATSRSGQTFTNNYFASSIGSIILLPDHSLDQDGDGMSDRGERIIGTDEKSADSDNDGISDLAEIRAGTDPLGGRAFSSGVVASLSLQGEAKGITIAGSTISSEIQTAYVATGSYGLAVIDASNFRTPLVLGQLDLSGDAVDVSVDSFLGMAAVASGTGGLNFVDVSKPNSPTLLRTIAINVSQVEVFEGVAYIASGSEVQAYDLLTGEKLAAFAGASAITGLAREGQMLYTMDASRTLRAIDISGGSLVGRGTVVMPSAGNKLSVGNGVAYVAAGNGGTGGFMTANVANPNSLQLLSGIDNNGVAGTAIALNGSGLAVVAGSSSFVIGGFRSVDVMNVSDPANTGSLITRFNLSQVPFDIAIGAGIAFVADGTGDLQVVNYLPFDNQRVAPVVTATLDALDLDPATPGIQVLEGSLVRVRPTVTDDVQVRNVELLRGGLVAQNDVSFPFEMSAVLPTIAANGSNLVTLQVRATDTGGNFGLSAPITVQLVPDTFGPTLVSSTVNEGGIFGRSFRSVTLTFSEAIDQTSFTTTAVQLVDSNGIAKSAENIQFRADGKQVQLTFAQQPVGAYTLRIDRTQVKDRVGNAMGTGFSDTHFTINQFSVEWIAPTGGNWNTAANWSTGFVPITTDDVFIGVTSSPVVISSGTVTLQSLISNSALTLSGGTLTLNGDSQINGAFVQSGGILGGAGKLILNGSASITGGTMRDAGTTLLNGATTISGSGLV